MRDTLLRLIFIIRIIKYECARKTNKKLSFKLAIINLNIK